MSQVKIKNRRLNIVTIAGTDSMGGAGVTADIEAIQALGCHGYPVITAVVAQNPKGVSHIMPVTPENLKAQLFAISSIIEIDAIKIGMFYDLENLKVITAFLKEMEIKNNKLPVILDPVLSATSGGSLMEEEALAYLFAETWPYLTLITPNIPEYKRLLARSRSIMQHMDLKKQRPLLIKGGHHEKALMAQDYLLEQGKCKRIYGETKEQFAYTHGTGCALSTAIAVYCAKEYPLEAAIQKAKNYVTRCLREGYSVGNGYGAIARNKVGNKVRSTDSVDEQGGKG